MFFACEGKRPPPFQCSVVLGARQLTDVTCARLFALPDGEFLQPLDVGFPASSFFCSITPTSAANNMNANMAAKNDFGIRFPYRSLVYCKREETPEGALHAEELL